MTNGFLYTWILLFIATLVWFKILPEQSEIPVLIRIIMVVSGIISFLGMIVGLILKIWV